MIKTIFVIGERCSGTNYLCNQLEATFGPSISVVSTCKLGYKHWPHLQGLHEVENLGIVVITRNILDWLQSFSKKCYNVQHLGKGGVTACISTSPWWSHIDGKLNQRLVADCNLPYGNFYRDIFEMRRNKFLFWREALNQVQGVPNLFIRYEDLATKLEDTIEQIAMKFGLPVINAPQIKTRHSYHYDFSPTDHLKSQIFIHKNTQAYSYFQLHQIKQRTDWKVEIAVGYSDIVQLLSLSDSYNKIPHPRLSDPVQIPLNIAYIWHPSIWKNKQHYIKEEEVGRWALFADIVDLEKKLPFTLARYDHVILESSALRKHLLNSDVLDLLKSAKAITLDCHDLHDRTFKGGRLALIQFIKSLPVTALVVKNFSNAETKFITNRLESSVKVHHVSFGVPEQFIPPPAKELLESKWAKRETKPKTIGVFVYGNLNPKFYPLRYRIAQVLKKLRKRHSGKKNNNPFQIVIHNGKGTSRDTRTSLSRKKLFNKLQSSWLSLCTPSKYNYTVLKYWEATGAGCSILGPIPGEFPLKTGPVITASMTDKQILRAIITSLKQKKQKLLPRIKANYRSVALNHTLILKIIQTIRLATGSKLDFSTVVHHWITGARQPF
jgi:hypothetical protein